MIQEKKILYKKAYVELLELIKNLSKQEQNKIPKQIIDYLEKNKDTNYIFRIDENKEILEQEYMVETKALIVKLYEKFLVLENEKELWKKYDRICFNKIEEEKRNKYPVDIFKNENNFDKENNNTTSIIIYQEKSFFKKIIINIIKFFKDKDRKDK